MSIGVRFGVGEASMETSSLLVEAGSEDVVVGDDGISTQSASESIVWQRQKKVEVECWEQTSWRNEEGAAGTRNKYLVKVYSV